MLNPDTNILFFKFIYFSIFSLGPLKIKALPPNLLPLDASATLIQTFDIMTIVINKLS